MHPLTVNIQVISSTMAFNTAYINASTIIIGELDKFSINNEFDHTEDYILMEYIKKFNNLFHAHNYYGAKCFTIGDNYSELIHEIININKITSIEKRKFKMLEFISAIVDNSLINSTHNLVVKGMPMTCNDVNGKHIIIDPVAIYDTLIDYGKINAVVKLSDHSYLVWFDDNYDAYMCAEAINSNYVEYNVIWTEYKYSKKADSSIIPPKINTKNYVNPNIDTTEFPSLKKCEINAF